MHLSMRLSMHQCWGPLHAEVAARLASVLQAIHSQTMLPMVCEQCCPCCTFFRGCSVQGAAKPNVGLDLHSGGISTGLRVEHACWVS